ncbi:PadR family transcriptional regulator [Lacticigenium naphthae]|uniref:PadR family transcriptional regulator n=1 Tax=Lacticigenium naphthae TaxID=515351 RepID=UPI00040A134D|nr:PadR family transcriptional regulator [Lacticigenium naphthae]
MVSSDSMRGFNDLIILSLLDTEDSYGYKLSNQIKKISKGNYVMKETTLYSAFNRLEKKNWIASYKRDETFGKPRTYYRMTSLGREIYHTKKKEWQETQLIINTFLENPKGE